jgi:hypothetical protein
MKVNGTLSRRIVRHLFAVACLGLAVLLLALTWLLALSPDQTGASSHREAPLISGDPTVDNLDLYAFVSPDKPDSVTLIATWIPFEEPGGGPNFYHFDPNARYNIYIDRDGNAKEDIIYRWTFSPVQFGGGGGADTFLYNTNQIDADYGADSDFNIRQYYTVTVITTDTIQHSSTDLFVNELMPPDNIGPRSIPSYDDGDRSDHDSITDFAINTAGDYQEFTGQRDDPFYVDVGSIFDLAGLRPFNDAHLIPLDVQEIGQDVLAGYNTHATAIQAPISELVGEACDLNDATDTDCVIGVWSTADRCSTIVLGPGTATCGDSNYVQVSRLGNPLVNEVVIDLEYKDAFNAVPPSVDATLADVVARVTDPEVAALMNLLYGSALAPVDTANRADLVTVFLTGIPSAPGYPMTTQQTNSAATPSEQLRLNVAVKPTEPACQGDQLGLFSDGDPVDADDLVAFPNGRRLEDDVTDMALRAVGQGYGATINAVFGELVPAFKDLSPNKFLSDGVSFQDALKCQATFPYMGAPFSGYENHHSFVLELEEY